METTKSFAQVILEVLEGRSETYVYTGVAYTLVEQINGHIDNLREIIEKLSGEVAVEKSAVSI